ncbi:hypothetical protein QTN25_008163 [Entamoeba marina]
MKPHFGRCTDDGFNFSKNSVGLSNDQHITSHKSVIEVHQHSNISQEQQLFEEIDDTSDEAIGEEFEHIQNEENKQYNELKYNFTYEYFDSGFESIDFSSYSLDSEHLISTEEIEQMINENIHQFYVVNSPEFVDDILESDIIENSITSKPHEILSKESLTTQPKHIQNQQSFIHEELPSLPTSEQSPPIQLIRNIQLFSLPKSLISSNDATQQPTSILSETTLIRDLLLILEGKDGKYIKLLRDRVNVIPTIELTIEQQSVISIVSKCGLLIAALRNISETTIIKSVTQRALISGTKEMVLRYSECVAAFQRRLYVIGVPPPSNYILILQQQHNFELGVNEYEQTCKINKKKYSDSDIKQQITLHDLYLFSLQWVDIITQYFKMVNYSKSHESYEIINYVKQTNSPHFTQSMHTSLNDLISNYYFTVLQQLLSTGVLQDPYHEIFIVPTKNLYQPYQLHKHLPYFIKPDIAQMILDIANIHYFTHQYFPLQTPPTTDFPLYFIFFAEIEFALRLARDFSRAIRAGDLTAPRIGAELNNFFRGREIPFESSVDCALKASATSNMLFFSLPLQRRSAEISAMMWRIVSLVARIEDVTTTLRSDKGPAAPYATRLLNVVSSSWNPLISLAEYLHTQIVEFEGLMQQLANYCNFTDITTFLNDKLGRLERLLFVDNSVVKTLLSQWIQAMESLEKMLSSYLDYIQKVDTFDTYVINSMNTMFKRIYKAMTVVINKRKLFVEKISGDEYYDIRIKIITLVQPLNIVKPNVSTKLALL